MINRILICQTYYLILLFLVAISSFLLTFVISTSTSYAQVIPPHVSGAQTDCFRFRGSHPVTGRPRQHTGHDYGTASGTVIAVPPGYTNHSGLLSQPSGAGNYVTFTYPNGVQTTYMHLQDVGFNASAGTITTGATGGVTGPHLHYRIRIDGVAVDPEEAVGLDLSDPAIRQCLKDDAAYRLTETTCQPRGTCGSGGTPPDLPATLTPPSTSGPAGNHYAPSGSRPEIVPPTYTPPSLSGGPENGVGPPPGGPVLWDATEIMMGAVSENACDPEVYVVMRGRAAMEAQEDIVASEMVIHRPDSVMEYTCLDEFIGFTAERADTFFSGRNTWSSSGSRGNIALSNGTNVGINVFLDPTSLDQILEETVVASIFNYVSQQFPLTFLGDTSGGLDGTVSPTIGGATYTCSAMNNVWQIAKCENFADPRFFTGPGPFYTYNEMIPNTNDPRTQYSACNDTGLYDVDIEVMTNAGLAYHGSVPATLPGIDINDYVNPSEVCTGLAPISTGVNVVNIINFGQAGEIIQEYEEHFCANPSCYYDPFIDSDGDGVPDSTACVK